MISATTRALGDATLALGATVVAVGDAEAPELWSATNTAGPGWQGTPAKALFVPYAVLYPGPDVFDGSLADPDKDVWWTCQWTSVGASRQQAAEVADLLRAVMQPQNFTLAGQEVVRCYPDGSPGVRADQTLQPTLFYSPDLYRFLVFSTL